MDREEREEIPWSALVAEVEGGVDRRWYIVATVVGVLVAMVLGYRLLGGNPQPRPTATPIGESTTSTAVHGPAASEPNMVVAESDLRADGPQGMDRVTEMIAEMFVIDFFTNDGADETARSIVAAVDPGLREEAEAVRSAMDDRTFVEWAKVFAIDPPNDGVAVVRVAYRVIVATADGFDRLPLAAVELRVAGQGGPAPARAGAIVSLPKSIDPP